MGVLGVMISRLLQRRPKVEGDRWMAEHPGECWPPVKSPPPMPPRPDPPRGVVEFTKPSKNPTPPWKRGPDTGWHCAPLPPAPPGREWTAEYTYVLGGKHYTGRYRLTPDPWGNT